MGRPEAAISDKSTSGLWSTARFLIFLLVDGGTRDDGLTCCVQAGLLL